MPFRSRNPLEGCRRAPDGLPQERGRRTRVRPQPPSLNSEQEDGYRAETGRKRRAACGHQQDEHVHALSVYQPVLERVLNELSASGKPKLLLDVGPMRLHGANAEIQLLCDLAVGVP